MAKETISIDLAQFLDLGLGTSPLTHTGYTQLLSPKGEIHFKKFTH